jgi:hypothetical protein
VERLLTVVRTCKLQELNALVYLTAAIAAHRRRQPVPSLLRRPPDPLNCYLFAHRATVVVSDVRQFLGCREGWRSLSDTGFFGCQRPLLPQVTSRPTSEQLSGRTWLRCGCGSSPPPEGEECHLTGRLMFASGTASMRVSWRATEPPRPNPSNYVSSPSGRSVPVIDSGRPQNCLDWAVLIWQVIDIVERFDCSSRSARLLQPARSAHWDPAQLDLRQLH